MTPPGEVFTLHGLLERAARHMPDQIALSDPDGSLTYEELAAGAASVASALGEHGVRPGDRVAIWASKSARTVTSLYGILWSGATYVPIDPLAPAARARQVLSDADCRVLCASGDRVQSIGDCAAAVVALDDLQGSGGAAAPRGCESDLAYLLYTSGSTGRPKGVMLTHRNVLAFVQWTVDRFGVRADDQLSSHAPFHFDLSTFDLYGSAMAGATLNLMAPGEESLGASMAAVIRDRRISVWYSVPSALVQLCGAASEADVSSLRVVLFAGEVFPIKHLRRLRELAPQATLGNLYGPTETNVCTYHVVPDTLPDGDRPLPIGRACENQEVFALDEQLAPVDEGAVGELWVRGPTVMKGYWGDPALTQERLRQNPLHNRYPDTAYRTGDLVRSLAGGEYEFLGRRDHQVKSRGYRIELGDVEAALLGHAAVREAAVVAVPDERLGHRLVGYVASEDVLKPMELKRHCANSLPRYMVPASIVVEQSLPHTSTGKIDRQALSQLAKALGVSS